MLLSMAETPNSAGPLTRPVFTLKDAAQRCGVSFSTIRRRREEGNFPNAYKTSDGEWRVPVEDLLAVGLNPAADPLLTERAQATVELTHEASSQSDHEMAELRRELDRAHARLEVEQAHRAAAERVAEERERSLHDLRSALRLIAPPAPAPEPAAPEQPAPKIDQPNPEAATLTGAFRSWRAARRG